MGSDDDDDGGYSSSFGSSSTTTSAARSSASSRARVASSPTKERESSASSVVSLKEGSGNQLSGSHHSSASTKNEKDETQDPTEQPGHPSKDEAEEGHAAPVDDHPVDDGPDGNVSARAYSSARQSSVTSSHHTKASSSRRSSSAALSQSSRHASSAGGTTNEAASATPAATTGNETQQQQRQQEEEPVGTQNEKPIANSNDGTNESNQRPAPAATPTPKATRHHHHQPPPPPASKTPAPTVVGFEPPAHAKADRLPTLYRPPPRPSYMPPVVSKTTATPDPTSGAAANKRLADMTHEELAQVLRQRIQDNRTVPRLGRRTPKAAPSVSVRKVANITQHSVDVVVAGREAVAKAQRKAGPLVADAAPSPPTNEAGGRAAEHPDSSFDENETPATSSSPKKHVRIQDGREAEQEQQVGETSAAEVRLMLSLDDGASFRQQAVACADVFHLDGLRPGKRYQVYVSVTDPRFASTKKKLVHFTTQNAPAPQRGGPVGGNPLQPSENKKKREPVRLPSLPPAGGSGGARRRTSAPAGQ